MHSNLGLSKKDKSYFIQAKKHLVGLMILFLISVTVFFAVKVYNELTVGKYANQQLNTLSVSGEGEIFVKPDIAKVAVSIEKEAENVALAQKQATRVSNDVVSFLKGAGVEEKDIKTTNYSIYPRYDYLKNEGRVLRGYVVNQSLEIKIRKIENAGNLLSGITVAGANQVGGVSFTIDDEEAIERKARQKAIGDAREKAGQLAKDLGVKIVRLKSFSESTGGISPRFYSAEAVPLGIGGGSAKAPEIPVGENKVSANVTLIYEVR